MAISKATQEKIRRLYEIEGLSQDNIQRSLAVTDESPSLKTVQNIIERNNYKKNSGQTKKWTSDRKWTGTESDFIHAGMDEKYYSQLVRNAKRSKKRWIEWFIVEVYKREKKSWDQLNSYVENNLEEINTITSSKNKILDFFSLHKKPGKEFIRANTISRKTNLGYNIGLAGLTVLNEWLGIADNNLNRFIYVTESDEPYSLNADRSAFKKNIVHFSSEYRKKISEKSIDFAIKGDPDSQDTIDIKNGLDALYERLPLFDYVPKRSKYKNLQLHQIFLMIFKSEPIFERLENANI